MNIINFKKNIVNIFLIFLFVLLINTSFIFSLNDEMDYSKIYLLNNDNVNYFKENLDITILPIFDDEIPQINSKEFNNYFKNISEDFDGKLILLFNDLNNAANNQMIVYQSKEYLTSFQINSLNDVYIEHISNSEFQKNSPDYKENYLILVNYVGNYIISNNNLSVELIQKNLNTSDSNDFELIKNKSRSFTYYLLFYFSLILFIFAIFLLYYYLKLNKENSSKSDEKYEFNQLRNYVLDNLNKGYNLDQIKVYLLQNKYDENLVNQVLNSIKR